MADIKNLQEKVQKATEKVEKCKGTIARHEKQLQKKIDINDEWGIRSKESDIKGAKKKLREAEIVLGNWQSKLDIEIEKERFLNDEAPQVIKDFLQQWKEKVYDWCIVRYNDYQEFKKKLAKKVEEAYLELGIKQSMMPNKAQREALEEMGLDYKSVTAKRNQYAGQTVLYMDTIRNESERLSWLDKELENEKKAKMIDLIHRINTVVGTITDATQLRVSVKGNLDGIVVGEKGKAKVETIGAGGFNIQCFHYRTLVHPVK